MQVRNQKIFHGRGSFVELGHFDKHFVKNTRKKSPTRKHFGVLSPTLKITFWMENLTLRWIQPGLFFRNQGTFFDFQKQARKASPTPVLDVHLWMWLDMHQYPWIFLNILENAWVNCWLCQGSEHVCSSYMFNKLLKMPRDLVWVMNMAWLYL